MDGITALGQILLNVPGGTRLWRTNKLLQVYQHGGQPESHVFCYRVPQLPDLCCLLCTSGYVGTFRAASLTGSRYQYLLHVLCATSLFANIG